MKILGYAMMAAVGLGVASGQMVAAERGATTARTTSGGTMELEIRADYLSDFDVEMPDYKPVPDGRLPLQSPVAGTLTVIASPGTFDGFSQGRLEVDFALQLRHNSVTVGLGQMTIIPAEHADQPALEAYDSAGRHMLTLTHLHAMLQPEDNRVAIRHADVVAGPGLASKLELGELDGMVIGSGSMDLELEDSALQGLASQDPSPLERGLSCDDRPFWPQDGHEIDIAMIDVDGAQYQGTDPDTGYIKLAPSARLQNVSSGDVPWIAKFESFSLYPHTPADQHPYLVWSLYRIHDGRIEQLAISGAKHAFNAINLKCDLDCAYLSGDVLGPGCEDVYGVNTNDRDEAMGPRDEIQASEGLFESTCSFFDPDCKGSQTNDAEEFENRLLVDPAELQTGGAEYFLEAWYLTQYDVNIFNSMGHRQIDPQPLNEGWTFQLAGDYVPGPAVDQWLGEDNGDPWSARTEIVVPPLDPAAAYPDNMAQGHARLSTRVALNEDETYRYIYSLQNFDLDRGIDRLTIPLHEDTVVTDHSVTGPGTADQWTFSTGAGEAVFEAPENEFMSWMALYAFEIITTTSPARSQVSVGLAGAEEPTTQVVDSLAPGNDFVFFDRFAD